MPQEEKRTRASLVIIPYRGMAFQERALTCDRNPGSALCCAINGIHNDIATCRFARRYQFDHHARQMVEESSETSRLRGSRLNLFELSVRARDHEIGTQGGVALGPGNLDPDGVRHIVPGSSHGPHDA